MVKSRLLGRTGLEVSEISFGAGGFWGFPSFPEKQAAQLVEIALEQGVTLFDTGPNYSNGNAEARLGRILGGRSEGLVLGTKAGTRFVKGRHVKDYSPRGIESSVTASLRNLRLDHLPLLHFHGFPSPAGPAVEKLLELKERGLVGNIGVSTNNSGAVKTIGSQVFDSLMIEYNIINSSAPARLIESAGSQGVGVIVKSPLAQTLYSKDIFRIRRRSDLWYLLRAVKNHRSKMLRGRSYRFINEAEEISGSEVALNFVLSHPLVSSAVVGTVNPEHLRSNLQAPEKNVPDVLLQRIAATA